jgi:hypothetical protein
MKEKYLFIIIAGLVLNFYSCKKDNASVTANALIVGKWYVNKIHIRQQTFTLQGFRDTTYTGSAFNNNDYFQFNSYLTAVQSFSAQFTINGKSIITDGNGHQINGGNSFAYSISDSTLTLTSTLLIPHAFGVSEGPTIETIVQLDSKNLVLHQVLSGLETSTVTDTYYTRGY